jgi:predicted RNase H-like nuclease
MAGDDATGVGPRVLGLDGAGRHGWVGVLVDGDGYRDAAAGTLAEVVAWAEPLAAIGIDIPIGTVPGGRARLADVEARRFIGPRGSSVFAAPPLDALRAPSYAEANELLGGLGVARISRQAWALVPRIVEAAEAAAADPRLHEVHPEVSFCELAGVPLAWSKKSWNGLLFRRRVLADAGIVVPDAIPGVGGVVADDVVDAAVVAWSARRIARGEARTLPAAPEPGDGGRSVAIWC